MAWLTILYGAAAALAQTNLRRMLAYASLSHVGLVVLGIASFNLQGLQGAVLQLLNFTLAAGGLFLLHQRTCITAPVRPTSPTSAARPAPCRCWPVSSCSTDWPAWVCPAPSGFPAELLILMSTFERHAGAGLAALVGMVLGAAYFLGLYRRAFFGPTTQPADLPQTTCVRASSGWHWSLRC